MLALKTGFPVMAHAQYQHDAKLGSYNWVQTEVFQTLQCVEKLYPREVPRIFRLFPGVENLRPTEISLENSFPTRFVPNGRLLRKRIAP